MGLSREALPLPTLQPPAVFPKPLFPALPVRQDPEQEALLEIKRSLLASFRTSRFAEAATQAAGQVQRYSDRYTQASLGGRGEWDMRLFPSELRLPVKKAKRLKLKSKEKSESRGKDALAHLPSEDVEDKSSEESEGDGVDGEEEREAGEEAGEEETDYALSYFDNGESFLDADREEDGDEGPTY